MSDEKKTTAVATKQAALKGMLAGDAFQKQIAMCLPQHLKAERFCRIAITALTKTPKLADCTQVSLFGALLTLSQYGLEPDGRHAHLIPYGNVCQLIIDYKGLLKLIYRNKDVATIKAAVVCENDEFLFDRQEVKAHKINFRGDRGDMYAAWATVTFKNGAEVSDCMTKKEIDAIRSRSRASGNGPWVTDYNEMAKKTVLRRLSKMVPLPSEVQEAINDDDDTPRDIKKVHTIDIPAELITDGSDKAHPEDDAPDSNAPNTGAANLADRLKKDSTGLSDEQKKQIEAEEAAQAARERGELV
jgi:recombination protein RecT